MDLQKIKYKVSKIDNTIGTKNGKLFEYKGYQFGIDKNNIVSELSTGAIFWREQHNVNMIVYDEMVIEKVKEYFDQIGITAFEKRIKEYILELEQEGFKTPINERFDTN